MSRGIAWLLEALAIAAVAKHMFGGWRLPEGANIDDVRLVDGDVHVYWSQP